MFSGLVATLCCVGPFILVVFGIGGASLLLGLLSFKWVFFGAGAAVMAVGVALALWQSHRTCDATHHRRHRWLYPAIGLAGFAAVYAAANYILIPLTFDRAAEQIAAELRAAPGYVSAAATQVLEQLPPPARPHGSLASVAVARAPADPTLATSRKVEVTVSVVGAPDAAGDRGPPLPFLPSGVNARAEFRKPFAK